MPVFTANGITMWHAMNLVGEQVPNARFGSFYCWRVGLILTEPLSFRPGSSTEHKWFEQNCLLTIEVRKTDKY